MCKEGLCVRGGGKQGLLHNSKAISFGGGGKSDTS